MQKIIKIFVMILICLFIFYGQVYASYDPITNPDQYNPNANPNTEDNNTRFIEIGSEILGVIRVLGSFAAVITLMTLGIRYMLASAGEKATYKETMVPYLIGAIMVFAIPNIIGIAYDFIKANIK